MPVATSPSGLTVAVTGPTGEIGGPFIARARARRATVGRIVGHGPPSLRPGRPRLAQDGVPARRRPRPRRRSSRWSPTPTSSSTSPSSSWAAATRATRSTSRARATSSRRRSPPAPSGSSTPPRWRPTASTTTAPTCSPRTCRRAAPSAFYYSAQKAEVEGLLVGSARRASRPTPTSSGRASSPAPTALLLIEEHPLRAASPGALPGAVRRLFDVRADPQAGDPGSGRPVPARPPRRRRDGDARRRCSGAASPASTTSPRTAC